MICYKEKSPCEFPRFKWIEDPYNLFIWVFLKKRLHDDMMQCKRCNKENKSHDETQSIWKSSGASVSGRYNTPPLQEDLVPRSRMAPERNGRGRGKTNCFFDKRVKPKNLERLNNLKERKTTEMNKVESTPLRKRNKEEQIRTALRLKSDTRLDKMNRTWAEGMTLRLNG